ncbi:MAG: S8 family serine peptidase [Candidatus Helarchaeota archaeon]
MAKKQLIFIFLFMFASSLFFSSFYSMLFMSNASNQPIINSNVVDLDLTSIDFNPDQRFILVLDNMISLEDQITRIETSLGQAPPIYHVFSSFKGLCLSLTRDQAGIVATLPFIRSMIVDEKIHVIDPSDFQLQAKDTPIDLGDVRALIDTPATYDGSGIKIAVLDSGIYKYHVDLLGKVAQEKSFVSATYGWDEDDEESTTDLLGHGTHVAGIALGSGIGSVYGYDFKGVASGARLINAKCLDRSGDGSLSAIIAALEWAVDTAGADIVSMSLGFYGDPDPDHPISLAVDAAVQKGVIVVAGVGNEGPSFLSSRAPGSARRVISVGASDSNNEIASFSSRGPTTLNYFRPNVIAPGVEIYSALARGTYFEALFKYQSIGLFDLYVPLSGTSMATPVVSGAIAILKEAFPGLTPEAAKIALMETASNLTGNPGPNIQGAGLINVTAAFNFLNQNPAWNTTNCFNVSTVFPKNIPSEPFNIISYPGNVEELRVEVVKSYPDVFTMTIPTTLSPYLSFKSLSGNEILINSTDLIINDAANYSDIGIILNIPVNTTPNNHFGIIQVRQNGTGTLLHEIYVNLTVRFPTGRVYFDGYHNADATDTYLSNYNDVIEDLNGRGYDVVLFKDLITTENLDNFDILMLPDVEIMFSPDELNAITSFYQNGGSILILGAEYPNFAREPLNDLLLSLDSGISFSSTKICQEHDYGISRDVWTISIRDIEEHPITHEISSYTWLVGHALNVNAAKATVLARYSSLPVLAVSTNTNNSKLVVYGGERHFYDDLYYRESNTQLINQTFQWLLENRSRSSQINASLQVIPNATLVKLTEPGSTSIPIGLYAWSLENDTYLDNLSLGINATAILSCWNSSYGIWEDVDSIEQSNFSFVENGSYYINVTVNSSGYYRLNITTSSSDEGFCFFKVVNQSIRVQSFNLSRTQNKAGGSYSQAEIDLYRTLDQLYINATIESDLSLENSSIIINAYISSMGSGEHSNVYESVSLVNTTNVEGCAVNFSTVTSFSDSYPAGNYGIFIQVKINSSFIFGSEMNGFFINNEAPELNENSAMLNGLPLSMWSLMGIYVNYGSTLYFSIRSSDAEDSTSDLHVWVLLLTLVVDSRNMAYGYEVVMAQELTNAGNGLFSGSLTIPLTGITDFSEQIIPLTDSKYGLLLVAIDEDGEYGDDGQVMKLLNMNPVPITMVYAGIIILVITIVGSIALIVVYLFYDRKHRREIAPKKISSKSSVITCPKCGRVYPKGPDRIFCMNCGYRLQKESIPQILCSECGQLTPISPSHFYCIHCGTRIQKNSPQKLADPKDNTITSAKDKYNDEKF